MLTIFSIPKPFKGHIGTIQRNAISSWTLLRPRPEIILFGDEEGTAEVTHQFGLRHVAVINANEYGTPLLNDLFRRAELNAQSSLMCYVNADILLLSNFLRALEQASKRFDSFLIVSKRINIDISEPIVFDAGWEALLETRSRAVGTSGGHTAIDVFVFPKGTYPTIPDFGIGRLWFDQWLIKSAREAGIPVVDLSAVAPVLHQNHDYNHVAGGVDGIWNGKEAERNLLLYGGTRHSYTLLDVTHELTMSGALRRVLLRKPLHVTRELVWELFVQRTVGMRNALRLRKSFWRTSKSQSHKFSDRS
jgi:hypothetical protein